jgi:hypothetical protein
MDLGEWLKGLGLGQYADAFAENDIDFSLLKDVTDADLKELGVASLGHRKRLLAAIAQQNATPPAAAVHAEPVTGERRHVTIMFTDPCGFTALSQSLDPENPNPRASHGSYPLEEFVRHNTIRKWPEPATDYCDLD